MITPKVKQDNQRGAETLSYLFQEYAKDRSGSPEYSNTESADERSMDIPSLRDGIKFMAKPPQDNRENTKVRLGLGLDPEKALNKHANIFTDPVHEVVGRYRKFVKSPLLDSALWGSLATGATYLAGQYFNPITEEDVLQETADIIKKNKLPLTTETVKKAKAQAKSNLNRSKWLTAGAIGLGVAGINSAYHYTPGKLESLYKWSSENIRKQASIDPLATSMDINHVKAAVMDSSMTDGNKFLAMSMLDTIPKSSVNSDDIIGAAINTGVSAVGSPIGQYTVAAAMDAATGYVGGSLLGLSRPDRVAAAMGIGSFLARTLQPNI